MHLTIAAVTLIAAWRWGDWKNWKLYYPTILFMIVGNFLYNILTYHYPMWMYKESLLPNHTITDIFNSFVVFPAVLLLYLPHFPKRGMVKKVRYIILWIIVFVSAEWFLSYFGFFSYHNGWNIGWSFLFNIGMFIILIIHFKKPLLALTISVFVVIFLALYFDVPIEKMR
jgi:hypothetical protein